MQAQIERRQYERFTLQPMYTDLRVQRIRDGRMETLQGHAYDISEGGMRIELDQPLDIGEHVNATLALPAYFGAESELLIHASCRVVWVNGEEDDPACPRMALRVIRYFDESSHQRLNRLLGGGFVHRAA